MDRKLEQLRNFLESNDLGEYFDAITNRLKMKSVAKLKFISEDDLLHIGMSRPQIKMLFDCYRKEQSALGKLKRMFVPARPKSKVPPFTAEQPSNSGSNASTPANNYVMPTSTLPLPVAAVCPTVATQDSTRTFRREPLRQSARPMATQPFVSTPTSLRSVASCSSNSQSDSVSLSPTSTLASRFRSGLATLPSKPTRLHAPRRVDVPRASASVPSTPCDADGDAKMVAGSRLIAVCDIQLCKSVGVGEFATVYEAFWRVRDGEKLAVAVKVLRRERLQTNTCEFLKEALLALQISHEHILRMFGIVVDGESLMLVAELAVLKSLLECVRDPLLSRQFALPRLANFATQIADAMRYLEQRRLVHRDLAARNVLVFSLDTVKVSDFGMSRALALGQEYYRSQLSTSVKLPIAWCAPECINYLKFTSASDVWAFGVTLWEVFSYGEQPWRGHTAADVLSAISEPRCERPRRPAFCPSSFYRLLRDCWQQRPEHRPSFARVHTLLTSAECRIEQLPALADSDERDRSGARRTPTGDDRMLLYSRGDLMYVIDRAPSDPPARGFWFGVLATNPKGAGFFDPRHFVATTDSSGPGPDGLLNAGRSVLAFVRRSLRKDDAQNKRGLSRDMISAPQNDMRHIGHLGHDGSAFGDMRALGISEHVPPAAVLQIANADATLRRHSITRAASMARQTATTAAGSYNTALASLLAPAPNSMSMSTSTSSASASAAQVDAAKRGVQRQRSNAADSVASFMTGTLTNATDDTLTNVTTSGAMFASHYDEIPERTNDDTTVSLLTDGDTEQDGGGQVNHAAAVSSADSISAIVNVSASANNSTTHGNTSTSMTNDQLDSFDLNLNLLEELCEALNLSGAQSPNSELSHPTTAKAPQPLPSENGFSPLTQSWSNSGFSTTGAGKRNKLKLKLDLEPNLSESSYPSALHQPLLVSTSDGPSMRALSPADEKKLDNAIALAKECAAKSNASLNDRDRISSPFTSAPVATGSARERIASSTERDATAVAAAAAAPVSCSPNTSSVVTVSTVKSSDSDRDERDRESGSSSPTRKKAPFRISFHRRSSASPRGASSPKSSSTVIAANAIAPITRLLSYTEEMDARQQRSLDLSPSDLDAYNELVNKSISTATATAGCDDVDLHKIQTSASQPTTRPKIVASVSDDRSTRFEPASLRMQHTSGDSGERTSFSPANKLHSASAFLAANNSPKVLGRMHVQPQANFAPSGAINVKVANSNPSGYATLFTADSSASPLRLVRESGPFTSSMRVPPRRSNGVAVPSGALLPNRNALANADSGSNSSGFSSSTANPTANPLPVPPRNRSVQIPVAPRPAVDRHTLARTGLTATVRPDSSVVRPIGSFQRDLLRATVTGVTTNVSENDARRNSVPLEAPPAPPATSAPAHRPDDSSPSTSPFSIESFRDMFASSQFSAQRNTLDALGSQRPHGHDSALSSERSSATLTPHDDIQLDRLDTILAHDVSYEDLFELSQSQSKRCEVAQRTAPTSDASLKNIGSALRSSTGPTLLPLAPSANRSSLRVTFSGFQRHNAMQPDDVRSRRQLHTRTSSSTTAAEIEREAQHSTAASLIDSRRLGANASANGSSNRSTASTDTMPMQARLLLQLYQLGLNDVYTCKKALIATNWNLTEAVKLLVKPTSNPQRTS